MGQPITWRNVTGPGNGEAAQILEGSRQSINDSFSIFGDVLRQREAGAAAGAMNIQEGNKQAYLSALDQAKTPEQIAELQRSGLLDTLKQKLTPQVLAAVRGADEARVASVRQNAIAGNTFNDQLLARTEAPQYQAVRAAIAAGDLSLANRLTQESTVRDKAPLLAEIEAKKRGDDTYQHGLQMRPYQDNGVIRADTLGKINLTETERTTAEAARQRGVDDHGSAIITAYQTQQRDTRAAIEAGISSFPGAASLPRNQDGTLAEDQLDKPQREALDKHLQSRRLPVLKDLAGDTSILTRAEQSLREAGAKPGDMARLAPVLNSALSTTPSAPIGKEAALIERNQRIQDVNAKMNSAMFTPMVTPGAAEATHDAAKAVIDSIHPVGSYRNQNWTEAISNMKGIIAKDKDGKVITGADGKTPIRVMPGPAAIKQMLRGIDNSFWGWGNDDIKKAIKKWEEDSTNQIGAAASINDTLLTAIRGVNIQKPAQSK